MSPEVMNILSHSHAGSWFFTVLLFVISFTMLRLEKRKAQKITHMILRLFFLIMLITGVGMIIALQFPLVYIVKGILAFVLIYLMELILTRGAKGKENKQYWLPFAVVLPLVLLIGFNVISF